MPANGESVHEKESSNGKGRGGRGGSDETAGVGASGDQGCRRVSAQGAVAALRAGIWARVEGVDSEIGLSTKNGNNLVCIYSVARVVPWDDRGSGGPATTRCRSLGQEPGNTIYIGVCAP